MLKSQRPESPIGRAENRGLKHQRLRSQLLCEIAVGTYGPGDALPTEVQLAEMMQVSRTTVRQTLGDLQQQGLVRRVQGKGTFVAERPTFESGNRAEAFAIIVLDVSSGYYNSLLSGFEQACNRAGRPAVVCNSSNSIDKQGNYLLRLLSHRAAGVAINACSEGVTPPYHVEVLQDAGIPVVLLHRPIPNVSAPVLEIPGEKIGHRAGELLVAAGHRYVAYLDSHKSDLTLQTETGLRQALKEAGADLPEEQVDYAHQTVSVSAADRLEYEQHIEQVLPRLLSRPNRTTALFVGFDTLAEQVYLVAQRMGLRIPQDLSIVCFGGAHREGTILRRLTTVTIDEVSAGQKAVDLLQEMRDGKRSIRDGAHLELPLGFIEGTTLGNASSND